MALECTSSKRISPYPRPYDAPAEPVTTQGADEHLLVMLGESAVLGPQQGATRLLRLVKSAVSSSSATDPGAARRQMRVWLARRSQMDIEAGRRRARSVPAPGPAGGHPRTPGPQSDPLSSARRTLPTGAGLLTDKQIHRLRALFAVAEHVEVEATGRGASTSG